MNRKDLGEIQKKFYHFVIPSMLAFALSGIYAIADGFFVGNAMGDNALAAINIAYPMTAFLQAIGTGIGMGGAIEFTVSVGRGNEGRGRQYYAMSLLMLIGSGLLFTLLFLAIAPSMLGLFGAQGENYVLAKEYMRFISYGAIFQILGTGLVPFIRNMGGAVVAMGAMITGFVTNIILDYLFVWKFSFGMEGAAAATVIGQAMTFLVCLGFLIVKREKPEFHFAEPPFRLIQLIIRVGLSPFGLTFSPNITLMLVNKNAAIFGGTVAVTCYAPVSYICCVVLLLLQGISDGSQPLISLAYGKEEMERAHIIRNLAYRLAVFTSAVSMVLLFLVRGKTAVLFGASAEIAQKVASILPIFLIGYLFVGVSRVTTAYFYAAGKNLFAYLLIYGEPLILFLLLLFLPGLIGVWGVWVSVPVSQAVTAFLSVFLCFFVLKLK